MVQGNLQPSHPIYRSQSCMQPVTWLWWICMRMLWVQMEWVKHTRPRPILCTYRSVHYSYCSFAHLFEICINRINVRPVFVTLNICNPFVSITYVSTLALLMLASFCNHFSALILLFASFCVYVNYTNIGNLPGTFNNIISFYVCFVSDENLSAPLLELYPCWS